MKALIAIGIAFAGSLAGAVLSFLAGALIAGGNSLHGGGIVIAAFVLIGASTGLLAGLVYGLVVARRHGRRNEPPPR